MNKVYQYFISYVYEMGFGNAKISFGKKIEQYEDIVEIQNYINKEKGNKNTNIINYILLQESEE